MSRLYLFLLLLSFFLGGLGYKMTVVRDMGVWVGLILVFIAWIMNKQRLVIGRYMKLYFAIVVLVGWDVMTRANPFHSPDFFGLMLSGGLFAIASSTAGASEYRKWLIKWLLRGLVLLGVIFSLIYAWFDPLHPQIDLRTALVAPLTFEHLPLAIFWGVILGYVIPNIIARGRYTWEHVIPLVIGILIMLQTPTRSAYAAVIVGVGYALLRQSWHGVKRYWLIGVVGVFSLYTISVSAYKPIRTGNFLLPGLYTLMAHPRGVGVGHYKEITAEYSYLYETTDFITNTAHNLYLELLVGLGWVGLSFLLWTYLTAREIVKRTDSSIYLSGIFLGLSVVFSVEHGYMIPTLYWLWMSAGAFAKSP